MRQASLAGEIIALVTALVLAVVCAVGLAADRLIAREFEAYVMHQQTVRAEQIAKNLALQYDNAKDGWNADYIHGLGMYALDEGYLLRLEDVTGRVVWDAENHDMTLCHGVMRAIAERMENERPDLKGEFVSRSFPLQNAGRNIGRLCISYYAPYHLSDSAFQFMSRLNGILVSVGAVALIIAILAGVFLARHIAGPISGVVALTRKISQGSYQARIAGDNIRPRELAQLSLAVNQMAATLDEQERLRKRLVSDVAHELRTPLANVAAYLELLLENVWEPTKERLGACAGEIGRLSGLVADLERLRAAEDENLVLNRTDCALAGLARSAAAAFSAELDHKRLRLTITGTDVHARIDEARIRQVVTNLVSNAIKYTGEGGSLSISVRQDGDMAEIAVADTGMGIAREECGRIFERFYRTDPSRTRTTGGAGIGLAIVKSIVEAHGGTVHVASELGKGSTFTIRLPRG